LAENQQENEKLLSCKERILRDLEEANKQIVQVEKEVDLPVQEISIPENQEDETEGALSELVSEESEVQETVEIPEEVEKVVDYVKSQSEAQYDPNMTPSEVSSQGGSSSADDVDPLYKEVLLFIAKTQKASASLLQRRFKIGYNRAARIIDMLEEDGYIGPVDGSKPRKVFLEKEFAEDYE